ncbi:Poly [ADP-ribose] polymerase 2 [Entomortierella beljakovae]|nr:Poly [ADP-ribose] polymerase 2 [Entomortierella beljakovae]
MPPKRAPKGPIFKECVFAIAGTFAGKNHGEIMGLVTCQEAGATVSTTITQKVTHLITNQAEIEKASSKVTKAASIDTIIFVSLEWLTDSIDKKKRLGIKPYTLSTSSSSSNATTTAATADADADDADGDVDMDKGNAKPKRTKRKAADTTNDDDDVIDENVEKKIKTLKIKAEKASNSGTIRQPKVDSACTLSSHFTVYVDKECAWDARLNQTNIGQNNNKFYMIQMLYSKSHLQWAVFSHWGRVGNHGQTSTDMFPTQTAAQSGFLKKFKSKTGNNWIDREKFEKVPGKYFLLPPDDGDSDDEDEDNDGVKTKKQDAKEEEEEVPVPESKLHPKVQDIVSLIFNTGMMNRQMAELDYDVKKMPLGKLAKATILHGYQVLKDISEVINNVTVPQRQERLMQLSSDFYTVIPHSFGMRTPPIIRDAPMLKKKLEMLEALGEIEIAQKLIKETKKNAETIIHNPLDKQYDSLGLNKLEPMDKSSERFELIDKFVKNSHGATHNYYNLEVQEVFDLDRGGEKERFDESGFSNFHNRRLLWHGSRLTNYVGILSQGLRIAPPEAPVTGYMFDKGAYFADCVSKSANYCCTSHGNNIGLMLLCEVALGDMHELTNSDYHAKSNSSKAGKHSTKGLGRSFPDPKGDVTIDNDMKIQVGKLVTEDKSDGKNLCLAYNEFIVYDVSQIKMRYLVKMKFNYTNRSW